MTLFCSAQPHDPISRRLSGRAWRRIPPPPANAPIATDVWEGWIFLNHQKQPEVSLQEFLGDFGTRFAGASWENTDTSLYFEAHLDANWKVLADAFSETYHIPSIHPATIGKTFASARSEEHTSELQSLMRISYAVFCLKKKKQ